MRGKQANNNSEKALKPKYLDKSNRPTRIMLTDLCPQQKIKIGQLIKTLETRKKQNLQYQHIIKLKQQAIQLLQQKLANMEESLRKRQAECQQFKNQIQNNQNAKIQRDVQFEQLYLRLSQTQKPQRVLVNMSSNTDMAIVCSSLVQTQFKKKKCKDKQIQVQFIQFKNQRQNRQFYRPNSKSFQKIMNNPKSKGKSNIKASKLQTDSKNKLQNHKKLTVQELQNINRWEQNQQSQQQQNSNLEIQDTDEDDQFQVLAKKWLQLKQKNINQIKQNDYSRLLTSNYQQNEKREQVEQFNFKKSQYDQFGIDQIELNKALKGRNFSASRILNNSTGSTNRQNNRNQLSSIERQNKKNKLIDVRNNNNVRSSKMNIRQKEVFDLQKSSKNVDFYSSDIMDIVESLNS